MNIAARHRRVGCVGRSRAWLRLAIRFRRGVSQADRRDAERLAEAQVLAAIALQVRQSLWRNRSSDPLDHHGAHIQPDGETKMIWKSIVRPRAIASASARWSAMSGFARKTAETVSDFASVVHNLIMDVRDSYRPELHYMRGPGPKWRAKHQPWLRFDSGAAGQHQLSPVRRRNAANPTR